MATAAMTLAQLKKSRATRKVVIARVIQKIEADIAKNDVGEVELGLINLEAKEATMVPILRDLELLTDPAELDVEIEDNEACLETIVRTKGKATRYLATIAAPPPPSVTSLHVQSGRVNLKLPKLQIARFEGVLTDWERFWDQFVAGIDGNNSLNKVDKFNYLRGFLTGEALRTIQGLKLTEANYTVAIDLLKAKYGKTDVLVTEHMNALLKIAPVQMTRSGQDLRRFLEEFKMHMRALEALGTDVKSLAAVFCPIVLQSMPGSILTEWNRKTFQNKLDLDQLLTTLQEELENIEKVWRITSNRLETSKEARTGQVKKQEARKEDGIVSTTSSTLVASQATSKQFIRGKTPYCIFCSKKSHFTSACTEVVSNSARLAALRDSKRCSNCLSKAHLRNQCDNKIICRSCQQAHHTLLCPLRENNVPRGKKEPSEAKSLVTSASCHASTSSQAQDSMSVLQAMRVWLENNGVMQQVVVLLDGGSERSFVTKRIVQKFNLPTDKLEKVTVHSFGGNQKTQLTSLIPLALHGSNGAMLQINALQVEEICSGVTLWESSRIENFLKRQRSQSWSQLMGTGSTVSVDVLVGADWYWRIVTGHMKRLSSFLMASESIFGWVMQGRTLTHIPTVSAVAMFTRSESTSLETLERNISALWELDRSGTLAKENSSQRTLEETLVLQSFEETTVFVNGRYQVEIPWADNKDQLCNNFGLAKERLKKLILKLKKDPQMLERYRKGIYEYLQNGHTEEVPSKVNSGNPVYYMPHQPVVKEDRKTTKLRIVFDASSHSKGCNSLNGCQYAGPNLNPSILNLLLRFRSHKVAVSSDVEKAFLQVELKEKERDAARFLWTDEDWSSEKEPVLKIFRMTRVLFGMKASPFLLAAAIRLHVKNHEDSNPDIAALIDNNMYVDDLLTGSVSAESAYLFSKQASSLMEKGGMLLKKWATNDSQLRKLWQHEGLVSPQEPIELLKVLGLVWDPMTDLLSLKSNTIPTEVKKNSFSKRSVLELLARIFDPLGFISPKTVAAKLILQDIWRLKLGWDEEITEPLLTDWKLWKSDLRYLQNIIMPRWYGTQEEDLNQCCQLHIFCDASPRVYGAVAYLRIVSVDKRIRSSFVVSKSRVAPLEGMSIPRLELMGCLVGSRLADTIRQAWSKDDMETLLWTDSKVALSWIKGIPSKWKLFIGRRIQEIQALTTHCTWRYCSSKENIADIITRGQSLEKLSTNHAWLKGPQWLCKQEVEWPVFILKEDNLASYKEEQVSFTLLQVSRKVLYLIDPNRFGSWRKLIDVTAWVFRFINNCRKKKFSNKLSLSLQELQSSETYWFKKMQETHYTEEIKDLTKNSKVASTSSLMKFNPFLDGDGLIRMGGRLKFAQFSEEEKHPILLKENGLLILYVMHIHLLMLHGGVQTTLIRLRSSVWIIRGRQTVRKILRGCLICRKWSAKPVSVIEAPLPAARLGQTFSFHTTGLDFAGPLVIKVASERRKCYICLFTCAVTRAVHLELVTSQGIKHFLLAFRRFIARRGLCRIVYSDNAKTFQQADRMLREAWKIAASAEVQTQVAREGIEWRFIAPQAAWWGGFYERMVGSVKRSLRRILGAALLEYEELMTILVEIEAVINNRPLLAMTEDSNDAEYLTPAHFLFGRAEGSLAEAFPNLIVDSSKETLRRRWNFRKRLLDNFWKKWKEEYLLQLQSVHMLNVPKNECPIKLDDVVLLQDDRYPRGSWKKARVAELTKGRDGNVRSVMLQLSNGSLIRRAVQKICPLEIV